jgi:SpoVK/Ycf46/Vps4 family AAA+-type ATPase
LEYLKEYAEIKRAAFSSKARAAGVDAPKGLLMVGVPGSGKSLSAKAIAGGQMPLVRMDVGALMGSLVGQSEANMRLALKTVEAIAPVVLWIDEIEKALGGMGGESDGGTSTRVFGTLLTWMQECPAPVYTVATANDVRSLRPELLRRFDDVMWVDLPNAESRREIMDVHLSKRGHDSKFDGDDYEPVVSATWGFSGAEIEKVVKQAIERAFFQERDLQANDLLEAARRIVPVSVTMADQINNLRSWATNRAIPASQPLEAKPVTKAKLEMPEFLP